MAAAVSSIFTAPWQRTTPLQNYVFVHEFGHHFAGLADEYYTSAVAYAAANTRVEPWEPNATALLDPPNLKWRESGLTFCRCYANSDALAERGLRELLTRDSKTPQRNCAKNDAPRARWKHSFAKSLEHEQEMFASEKYAGHVGAFEGAIYEANGYYRPEVDCIMFTRTNHFCAVCRRAIERIINLYSHS